MHYRLSCMIPCLKLDVDPHVSRNPGYQIFVSYRVYGAHALICITLAPDLQMSILPEEGWQNVHTL